MNPISRLRTRARSEGGRSATGRPLSTYSPLDGVSSKPRMESSVDLPQPDGPAIDTYSPRAIARLMLSSACVSTSSVRKTLLTASNLISDSIQNLPGRNWGQLLDYQITELPNAFTSA